MIQGNPIVIKELVFENSFILGRDLPKLGRKFIKKHLEKIYIDIVVAISSPDVSNINFLKTFLSQHPGTTDSLKDLQIGYIDVHQRTVKEMEIQIRNEILPMIERNFSVNSYVNIIFGNSRSWESKSLPTLPYFVQLIKNVGEEPKILRINMENDAVNCQIIQKRVEKCDLMNASRVVQAIPGHGIIHGLFGHGGPLAVLGGGGPPGWGPPGPANPAGPIMAQGGLAAPANPNLPPGVLAAAQAIAVLGGPVAVNPAGPIMAQGGPANPIIPPGPGGPMALGPGGPANPVIPPGGGGALGP